MALKISDEAELLGEVTHLMQKGYMAIRERPPGY